MADVIRAAVAADNALLAAQDVEAAAKLRFDRVCKEAEFAQERLVEGLRIAKNARRAVIHWKRQAAAYGKALEKASNNANAALKASQDAERLAKQAKPAALSGKTCGHVNPVAGLSIHQSNPLECCTACGCTRRASELREEAARKAGRNG